MELYHGTISTCAENIINNGIDLKRGKKKVDFGQGFYTTPSYEFAKSTAINKAKKTNNYPGYHVVPMVLRYKFITNLLIDMNILRFEYKDLKWAQFIINNRNGFEYMNSIRSHFHNQKQKYDIIKGAIADNKISVLAKSLSSISEKVKESDISNMLYPYFTYQISFHTIKSLSCIELLECDIIELNREEGDAVNG